MNDPSLKYHGKYLKWEALWSEPHDKVVRFVRKEGSLYRVADAASLAELPDLVSPEQVRRYNAVDDRPALSESDRERMLRDAGRRASR